MLFHFLGEFMVLIVAASEIIIWKLSGLSFQCFKFYFSQKIEDMNSKCLDIFLGVFIFTYRPNQFWKYFYLKLLILQNVFLFLAQVLIIFKLKYYAQFSRNKLFWFITVYAHLFKQPSFGIHLVVNKNTSLINYWYLAVTLDVGLLLSATAPDLRRGVAPLGRRPWRQACAMLCWVVCL